MSIGFTVSLPELVQKKINIANEPIHLSNGVFSYF